MRLQVSEFGLSVPSSMAIRDSLSITFMHGSCVQKNRLGLDFLSKSAYVSAGPQPIHTILLFVFVALDS